jgi:hypothetical protein
MLMASPVSIANVALSFVGVPPITSFSDGSVAAGRVSRIYDQARLGLLRAHPWNFAVRRSSLAALDAAPPFGYARKFVLPSDFVRAHQVVGDYPYVVEGRNILSDAPAPLLLIYIADVTDANEMDASFRAALSAKIAYDLSYHTRQNRALVESLRTRFFEALAAARNTDGQEGTLPPRSNGSWLDSRR